MICEIKASIDGIGQIMGAPGSPLYQRLAQDFLVIIPISDDAKSEHYHPDVSYGALRYWLDRRLDPCGSFPLDGQQSHRRGRCFALNPKRQASYIYTWTFCWLSRGYPIRYRKSRGQYIQDNHEFQAYFELTSERTGRMLQLCLVPQAEQRKCPSTK